jgi:catechol 2,3-dioxygenase-like lactoylglutathione lyase family enzyme
MNDDVQPLGPITQILVPVADVDRAAAFYENVLGLPLLFRYPGNAFFDAHGVRLYLASPSEPGYAGPTTIYFRVDDVGRRSIGWWPAARPCARCPRSRIEMRPTTCGWRSSATSTATTSA